MSFANQTLADIVTEYPASVRILENYGLDYCCKGKQTLEKACDGKLNLEQIDKELQLLLAESVQSHDSIDFRSFNTPQLIDYILTRHHRYAKEALPGIYGHLLKVNTKHGKRHEELNRIFSLFEQVAEEITSHMKKEEEILFPAILRLHALNAEAHSQESSDHLGRPIVVMEKEHEIVGSLMEEIKSLTNSYTPPSDACMTYRLSFDELKEFEQDLHRHVHLENNILFPRVWKRGQIS